MYGVRKLTAPLELDVPLTFPEETPLHAPFTDAPGNAVPFTLTDTCAVALQRRLEPDADIVIEMVASSATGGGGGGAGSGGGEEPPPKPMAIRTIPTAYAKVPRGSFERSAHVRRRCGIA